MAVSCGEQARIHQRRSSSVHRFWSVPGDAQSRGRLRSSRALLVRGLRTPGATYGIDRPEMTT